MGNDIVIKGASELDGSQNKIFSEYTNKVLEDFIQMVIDQNRDALPTIESQKLVREFFLYGLLRASDQNFLWWGNQREVVSQEKKGGLFCTNNGILAVSDFDREVYIRGGDSYHGHFIGSDREPEGVEGTLLGSGYNAGTIHVPHSNEDIFADERMEKMFKILHYFSKQVRQLRGEPTQGLIIKDLSDSEPSAPYSRRDSKLPRIVLQNIMLIPGNRDKTIEVYK